MYTAISRDKNLYFVGGCVRDMLMGKEPKDIDYTFAGSEDDLLKLFPAASKVGVSFPVYLVDGNEVALTRTEESTGDSYGDFKLTGVGVSIEDDLNRRDFTMNQIAINTFNGVIVDPTGGREDIKNGIVRTTNKQAFIDDPVRILRGIRFYSSMYFTIEQETFKLMQESVHRLGFVTKERIVKELEKMWASSNKPSRFFQALKAVGGLEYISPFITDGLIVPAGPFKYHGSNTVFDHTMEVIDRVKENKGSFSAFIAALAHDFGKTVTPAAVLPSHYGHEFAGLKLADEFIADNKFDAYTNELVIVAMKNHMKAHTMLNMRPVTLVRFVKSVPKRMVEDFRVVVNSDHPMSAEKAEFFDLVFNTINTHRMTEENVKKINASSDKKATAETIVVNHLKTVLRKD